MNAPDWLSISKPEERAWFTWRGVRYEACKPARTTYDDREPHWIVSCPICGDGVPFSSHGPHDEMWLPHQVVIAADGAMTVTPSLVCPRKCGWHVTITNGVAT